MSDENETDEMSQMVSSLSEFLRARFGNEGKPPINFCLFFTRGTEIRIASDMDPYEQRRMLTRYLRGMLQ